VVVAFNRIGDRLRSRGAARTSADPANGGWGSRDVLVDNRVDALPAGGVLGGADSMVGGEEFGPYRLQRLIGRGGMGEVFQAYDVDQDREVAIKRLLSHMADDVDFQKRFRRESRVAARLRNPHVVPIHTYGQIEGRLFLDMRLVDGCDLERLLLDEGRLPAPRAVVIIGQVASALDSAHREGLVHRDVKPSNILLDRGSDDEDFVYLADFGITRASSGRSQSLTASHVVVGSLQYMAPEQFDGTAGPAADIYSLGCVFFQCLTGAPPFEVDGLPSLMKAHTDSVPPAPSQRCPEVPAAFDAVIERAMAKDPAERHASAAEFAKDARAALARSTGGWSIPTPAAGLPTAADGASDSERSPEGEGSGITAALTTPLRPGPGDGGTGDDGHAGSGTGSGPRPGPGDEAATVVPVTPPPPGGTPPPERGAWSRPSPRRNLVIVALAVALVAVVFVAIGLIATSERTPALPPAPTFSAPAPPGDDDHPRPAVSLDQPTVAGNFPTNGPPETVAISPDGKSAYLTITGDHPALEVIDVAGGQVVDDIPVPGPPYFVGLSPTGEDVYVTYYDRTQGQLVIGTMDTRLGQLDGAIPTGQRADQGGALTWLFGFAVSPTDPHLLYVPNMNASVISVLDPEKKQAVAQIPVPASPHWVALTPDGRYGYVTNHMPGQVTVIDTAQNKAVASVPIGEGQSPHSIAVSPDGRLVEEVNYDGNSVTFIDPATNKVIRTTPLPDGPQSIAFAPDGAHSYVVSDDDKVVSVVSSRDGRVTGSVPAGDGASMIAVTPDGTKAVVADKEHNDVTVLNVGTPGH
jgi:YVTN family beta-propeller protein